jgi:CPA1 family monovalent cation:H+ antiporter
MVDVEATIHAFAWMLLGAAVVGMLAWRIRLPYPVALVVCGVVAEETHLVSLPQLDPRVLLFVFLPPLLFDAAFRLDATELRSAARSVVLLAVPGTVATAAVVGGVLALVLHVPLTTSFLFGSIVAATDPVAVIAVFRGLNTPARLAVIVEGESLINDGVAITLYTVAMGLVTADGANVLGALTMFGREVIGGVGIGIVLGLIASRLTATIDDHLIEMTLSTALAYGSYLIAQSLETSGALACVAAGLIHGSYGREIGMSEHNRRLLDDLWEYFGFVANALVFLLVGFTANLASLAALIWPVAVSILAVLGARLLVILGPPLVRAGQITSPGERAVLIWGGLRGALTITLALALPPELPDRQLLIGMAFGVVLFSLVIQGVSLPFLIKRAGLARSP